MRIDISSRVLALAALLMVAATSSPAQPDACENLRTRLAPLDILVTVHIAPDPSAPGSGLLEYSGGIRYPSPQEGSPSLGLLRMAVIYVDANGGEWLVGELEFTASGRVVPIARHSLPMTDFTGNLTMRLMSRTGCLLSPVAWNLPYSVWPMGDRNRGGFPVLQPWENPDFRTLPSISPAWPSGTGDGLRPDIFDRGLPGIATSPNPLAPDAPFGQ